MVWLIIPARISIFSSFRLVSGSRGALNKRLQPDPQVTQKIVDCCTGRLVACHYSNCMQPAMKYEYSLIFLLFLCLAGCAGTGSKQVRYDKPKQLAQKQWQNCSHFPTVQLVDITDAGKVMVRDLSYSSPPVAFQRCLASVAYRQVLAGKRDAQSLVRDAYFIDTRPRRAYLFKPSGHYPPEVDQFSPDQFVYFFFTFEAPNTTPAHVSSVWTSPSGEIIRKEPRQILSKGAAARRWAVEQLIKTDKTRGRWSVNLFIENRAAGEYFFSVK